jgi:RimJ/RimL family protein N-acetyltransferase
VAAKVGAEPCLETPRLRLRQFVEEDLDAWARITADPEVMRYVGGKALSRDEPLEDPWLRAVGG